MPIGTFPSDTPGVTSVIEYNGQSFNAGSSSLPATSFIKYFRTDWAVQMAKALHPEICHYNTCINRITSNCATITINGKVLNYDSLMRATTTYAAALSIGLIDNTGKIKLDPYFMGACAGVTLKNKIDSILYTSLPGTNACVPVSSSTYIYNQIYGGGVTIGGGHPTDNNLAWQQLRDLYLSYKYQVQWKKEPVCTNTNDLCIANPTCTTSPYKNKVRRFIKFDYLDGISDPQAEKASVLAQMEAQCDVTCREQADGWIIQLKQNCSAVNGFNAAQITTLRTGLINVCKLGCDTEHVNGSSTIGSNTVTAAGVPRSFDDVLNAVLLSASLPTSSVCDMCHANAISFPGTFEKPTYVGGITVRKKLSIPNVLGKLTALENCYIAQKTASPATVGSFSNWLLQWSNTPLSTQQIALLKTELAPSNTALNLSDQITLPAYLEDGVCKSCSEITTTLNAYKASSACNITGIFTQNQWENFARYANRLLGFSLSGEEYFAFLQEKCTATNPAACSSQIMLCPRTNGSNNTADTSCVAMLYAQADVQAKLDYDAQIKALRQNFQRAYLNKCMKSVRESWKMNAPFREHHYTLYYYDQAGNLVKTIPPQGLNPLTTTQVTAVQAFRATPSSGSAVYPAHTLPTRYAFNTLNQVIKQNTPDGGETRFWYDAIGRVILSQDQRQAPDFKYSYPLYDALGRVEEVGERQFDTPNTNIINAIGILNTPQGLKSTYIYNFVTYSGAVSQITRTYYGDRTNTDNITNPLAYNAALNQRNRVSFVTFDEVFDVLPANYDYATFYAYDVTGNVKTILQEIKALHQFGHGIKRIDYDFDLTSGKVNAVYYQRGAPDQFTHWYTYDADNRLTQVRTSHTNNTIHRSNAAAAQLWDRDASYNYYKHGPLARTELGQFRVQGMDYAYTLQGWIKGVNAASLDETKEVGLDGSIATAGNLNQYVARDAYAYAIGYNATDYKNIDPAQVFDPVQVTNFSTSGYSLYNGNIRNITQQHRSLAGGAIGTVYKYDQLNRIKTAQKYNGAVTNPTLNNNYLENNIQYDANGNILTFNRNQNTGSAMDNMTYNYYPNSNKLSHITDAVAVATYSTDIDSQVANNYTYDGAGNLIIDASENLTVQWSPYGKVLKAVRGALRTKYGYDAAQNRVMKRAFWIAQKEAYPNQQYIADDERTYHIRDAQGNVMATYKLNYRAEPKECDYTAQQYYNAISTGNWDLAQQALAQGTSDKCTFVDCVNLNREYNELIAAKEYVKAVDVLVKMQRNGCRTTINPNPEPCIGLLSEYQNAISNGDMASAAQLLTQLIAAGCKKIGDKPDCETFLLAYDMAIAANDVSGALAQIAGMEYGGCLVDADKCSDYIALYNAAIAAGDLAAAAGALSEITNLGCNTGYPDQPICYYYEQVYYAAIAINDPDLTQSIYEIARSQGCVFANPPPAPDLDSPDPILFGREYIYTWAEQHLYGSSRLGVEEPKVAWKYKEGFSSGLFQNPFRNDRYISQAVAIGSTPSFLNVYNNLHLEGHKRYEISNHLGNVMAVITDRKRGFKIPASGIQYAYYRPAMLTATDYYAFGMEMPGRTYSVGAYRYGFNGKENDRNNFGLQLVQDYGMRLYNPALGKFLSVDPIAKQYPELTPYQFASNTPIMAIDLDGRESDYYLLSFDENTKKSKLTLSFSQHGLICDCGPNTVTINYKGSNYNIGAFVTSSVTKYVLYDLMGAPTKGYMLDKYVGQNEDFLDNTFAGRRVFL